MLLRFCRYMLSSIRVSVCRLVRCCVYIALFWKGTGRGRGESGDYPKWSTNPQSITLPHSSSKQNDIYIQNNSPPYTLRTDDGCSMYLRIVTITHNQNSATTQEDILHFCYCIWLILWWRTTSNLKQQNLYAVSVKSRLNGITLKTFSEHNITWQY